MSASLHLGALRMGAYCPDARRVYTSVVCRARVAIGPWVAACGLSTGCLVASPPSTEPAPKISPVLDLRGATPSIEFPIPVDRARDPAADERTKVLFDVGVRSEDRNEDVWYGLHADFGTDEARQIRDDQLAPSTFDDLDRRIKFEWSVFDLADGCHQLTLFVAHESNWVISTKTPRPGADPNEVATAFWWINVNPAPGERFTLKNCPTERPPE